MRRLAPVPDERESRPRSRRGWRLRRLSGLSGDEVGAAGRRASSSGVEGRPSGVEGRPAEDNVDGRRRGRGIVGVREAEVVETGDVVHDRRVTQPTQLTHGAVSPLDCVYLQYNRLARP